MVITWRSHGGKVQIASTWLQSKDGESTSSGVKRCFDCEHKQSYYLYHYAQRLNIILVLWKPTPSCTSCKRYTSLTTGERGAYSLTTGISIYPRVTEMLYFKDPTGWPPASSSDHVVARAKGWAQPKLADVPSTPHVRYGKPRVHFYCTSWKAKDTKSVQHQYGLPENLCKEIAQGNDLVTASHLLTRIHLGWSRKLLNAETFVVYGLMRRLRRIFGWGLFARISYSERPN